MAQLTYPSPEYLAGFFDGEGCVVIKRNVQKSGRINHILRVTIPQVKPDVLEFLHQKYGGNLWTQRNTNRRNLLRWQIDCDKAIRFLTDILPFLVLKKDEVELALQFQATKTKSMVRKPIDLAVIQSRDVLRERLSTMKWVEWVQ